MLNPSIARSDPDPLPLRRSAADVEQAAQRVAVALGLISLDDPLCTLSDWRCQAIRFLTRMALSERTWEDAELWCREYHAQQHEHKSFDCLTAAQQKRVVDVVQQIVSGAELYLEGYTEPLNEFTRRAARTGARPSDWLTGLPGGKAGV